MFAATIVGLFVSSGCFCPLTHVVAFSQHAQTNLRHHSAPKRLPLSRPNPLPVASNPEWLFDGENSSSSYQSTSLKHRPPPSPTPSVLQIPSPITTPPLPTESESTELTTTTTTAETTSTSGTKAILSTSFNVMKAMLGSGALALPSGLAAISDHKSMIWPANLLFLILGAMSAYTFALYGRLCHATDGKSLGDVWKKVHKSETSLPISIANFSFCYGACLIFLLIIGDTMSSLARAVLASMTTAGTVAAGWMASRQTAILSVLFSLLVPLCNLKSLAALAPVSIVGVLASTVSSAFVAWRCPALCATSPYQCAGAAVGAAGNFVSELPATLAPQFGTYSRLLGPAPLVLLGMGGMALMAHFSAADFYQELVESTPKSKQSSGTTSATTTKSRAPLNSYMKATLLSFITVGIVNALTLSTGFLTFGGNSAGMILNNYATRDFGAALSRMLVAVSMIGGFPLLFMALRSAAQDLFGAPRRRPSSDNTDPSSASVAEVENDDAPAAAGGGWKLKTGLLASLASISMVVKDAGFVVGLVGSVMGSAIIYTFPALMFLRMAAARGRRGDSDFVVRRGERMACRALVAFGVVASLLGGATTVLNTYFPHFLK